MRIVFLLLLLLSSPLEALEVSIGQGVFDTQASLKGLMAADIELDVTTLSVRQPPTRIPGGLPLSFTANLDLFQSKTVNQITDFASSPLSTGLPFIGGSVDDLVADFTPIPVPADYRVHGADINIGLAYDLLEDSSSYLGVGINTGLSLPYMETRNMQRDANVFLDLLEATSTDITTYKIGPAVYGSLNVSDAVSLNGEWLLNKHWGTLDNRIFGGGVDVEGLYSSFDVNLRFQPKTWPRYLAWLKHGYLVAGYRNTRWDYKKSTFSFQQGSFTVPAQLDMDFSKTSLYAGLGLSF